MRLAQEIGEGWGWGCTPFVEDEEHRRLLWLMAEYFRTVGFTDIRARLPLFDTTELFTGTLEDHRPDLTCRQNDSKRTGLIVEVVTSWSFWMPEIENRWCLLASAARLYGVGLHFAVRAWQRSGSLEGPLRRRLSQIELPFHHIWTA